ncbi:MAG: hypothetical protein U5O39_11920 [Gammaproteobacteria bacterium]|nr:hypothetical protein [Gammaproteobacteria bacterium]
MLNALAKPAQDLALVVDRTVDEEVGGDDQLAKIERVRPSSLTERGIFDQIVDGDVIAGFGARPVVPRSGIRPGRGVTIMTASASRRR